MMNLFVKEYLPELYQEYGEVIASVDVKSERREVDVVFYPTKPIPSDTLGLLGKLGQRICLFEVYRNAVTSEQIRECISKSLDVRQNKLKQSRREKQELNEQDLAYLWIITPTISERILREFSAQSQPEWENGIYFLAQGFYTGIIALHQLPVTKETLWLRILGKGKVQLNAIDELKKLPPDYPHRENILELVYGLLETLEMNRQKSDTTESEDQELIMSLRTVFREKVAKIEQEGIQQGIQQRIEKEKDLIIRQLIRKLGSINSDLELQIKALNIDDLERLGEDLFDFNSVDDLQQWLVNLN
jgi:hypothetical protein